MARIKMYAHRTMIAAAVLGFFSASSAVAYRAAGVVVSMSGAFGH
jgi:hypothetical protein